MTPDTRVLTADLYWEPAGKLAVGDELLAIDEEQPGATHRRWRRSVIEETAEVVKPCCRLLLEDGSSVVCPEEHQLLADHRLARRWLSASMMITGDRLMRATGTWEPDASRDAGYLAAAFDGEGNLRQKPLRLSGSRRSGNGTSFSLHFTQKNNAMMEEVRRCLDSFGFRYGDKNHDVPRAMWRLGITERAEVLRFLGQIRPLRLLALFDPDGIGAIRTQPVRVIAKEDAGPRTVITLRTSTRTCVADGLVAHSAGADVDSASSGTPWERARTCRGGHRWTPESTYIDPTYGKRACRICHSDRRRERRAAARTRPEQLALSLLV